MTAAHLPPTGSIEVVPEQAAADLVEGVARDAEDPGIRTERLLVVLDIDGTIVLEDETLSPGVVEAVEHAHRAGHEIMLATGRSWEGAKAFLESLNIAPEFVVCSNGAVILRKADAGDGSYERFHTETFDPTEVLALLREHLPDAKYMVELADGRRLYTEHLGDWNLETADRVPFEQLGSMPVCRIVVVSPGDTEQDFVELVERIGLNEVSYAVGWTAWLDIAPQGVDKGSALERVRTWLGIDPAHVLVIGDGRNDLGMFRWALQNGGRAVAMEQGPQEVRDAAGEITLSVQAGGVAEVLRNL
ncbi:MULTISPECIES: HAD hydrolase family protein [unclassified Microbacterium]|uniref:HAD family hydrolase n=1 Tax=unclassified Microbacterium TaxID=2609290 RepID=UPI00214B3F89|nr:MULTISPECIES: HAD hydrolase family protein [unclassified Microbacterium]MCR2810569.1 HAD hydrolase family protein [Microbacterium sp. zg.B185]WIM19553.1 HAD hydrolase family protein [Microbacterium sp. zg-B185]